MNMRGACLFVLVLLISCIRNGSSLECFTCASPEAAICGLDFSSSKVASLQCAPKDDVCIKGVTSVLGATVITRTCGVKDTCQIFDTCSVCTTDKCNSSTKLQFKSILLSLVGFIIIKFHF